LPFLGGFGVFEVEVLTKGSRGWFRMRVLRDSPRLTAS